MAEALKTFREGEDILASETNENNQFLLSKLSDNAAQVQAYVEGEVATIKSNVASVQATLQNNIDELQEKVEAKIVVVNSIKEDKKWCRIWSDGWCEQGGIWSGWQQIVFIKPFSDANYTLTLGINDGGGAQDNIQAVSRKDTGFNTVQAGGNGGSGTWFACGFIKEEE